MTDQPDLATSKLSRRSLIEKCPDPCRRHRFSGGNAAGGALPDEALTRCRQIPGSAEKRAEMLDISPVRAARIVQDRGGPDQPKRMVSVLRAKGDVIALAR